MRKKYVKFSLLGGGIKDPHTRIIESLQLKLYLAK